SGRTSRIASGTLIRTSCCSRAGWNRAKAREHGCQTSANSLLGDDPGGSRPMLSQLSIRDIVLIERLDLEFAPGLTVLTGETGAGKSILLDALGLALGARADSGLLRHGAEQASVTAAFALPAGHPSQELLKEQELEAEEGTLVLRRVLGADGRSRAFVNDQPASVGLLRSLGDLLVEVQGQFEQRGLLDGASHRGLLDAYAGLQLALDDLRSRYEAWRAAAE